MAIEWMTFGIFDIQIDLSAHASTQQGAPATWTPALTEGEELHAGADWYWLLAA